MCGGPSEGTSEVHLGEKKSSKTIRLRACRGYAWVNLRGRAPERIELAPTFAYGDRAGARYQAQLEAASNQFVRDLARDLDPTVSTFEHQKRAADMTPPRAPVPDLWTGPRVIDKTAPRKTEEELAEEQRAERQRKLLAMIEGATDPEERAISGGHR